MFTSEIRKATVQGVVAAMTGSARDRAEWRASFEDLLQRLGGSLSGDEQNYVEALVLMLGDADRLSEADQKVPESFSEDWHTILELVNRRLGGDPAGETVNLAARRQIMNNTVAVLTSNPERKQDWLKALGGLVEQGRQNHLSDFVTYADILIRLLQGRDPQQLGREVPAVYRSDWEQITAALNE